jgi:hypothetical protein
VLHGVLADIDILKRTEGDRICFDAWHRSSVLMGQGQQLDFEGDVVGCLCSLRARMALDGVSWVRSGLVEIAVGRRIGRMHRSGPSYAS